IAQTEALVSIDVNSGRSTRERGIEETALKTNLEAADEVARQLRLRDLAGLIVIDFIDMESRKHRAMVERRLKDALRNDRARIQVGHISHFGLLEMSRQRLRPSLAETSLVACPHCGGAGHVRSVESGAIHVLRAIEEEGGKRRASLIMVHCTPAIALYLLNNKRERLAEVEKRYVMRVHFTPDDGMVASNLRIDRLRPAVPEAERPVPASVVPVPPAYALEDEDAEDEDTEDTEPGAAGEADAASGEDGERRRRRRRRRGGRRESANVPPEAANANETADADAYQAGAEQSTAAASDTAEPESAQPAVDPADFDENGLPRSRGPRRSRRGGRRRGGPREAAALAVTEPGEADEVVPPPQYPTPVHAGPTPADPFARHEFDIYDLMDRVEQERAAPASPLEIPPVPPDAAAPVAQEPVIEPVIERVIGPALEPVVGPVVEPVAEPPVEPVAEPPVEPVVEPLAAAAEPTRATPEVAAAETAPSRPAEPVIGPAVQPVVIGVEMAAAAERKRGWWRR
ncbi:MAG: ribonuclease E/G, partial [Acidisphaera sp.]|nr:ribonuclease E/G [Acidisphaera sp.]